MSGARACGLVKVVERQAANAKPLKTAIASQEYTKYDASTLNIQEPQIDHIELHLRPIEQASGKPLMHLEAG